MMRTRNPLCELFPKRSISSTHLPACAGSFTPSTAAVQTPSGTPTSLPFFPCSSQDALPSRGQGELGQRLHQVVEAKAQKDDGAANDHELAEGGRLGHAPQHSGDSKAELHASRELEGDGCKGCGAGVGCAH
eukprot:1159915-Pelagomonas_calceolata.AAC.8